ncbi:MAG: hypothetical protein QW067_09230 [Thermofilaceae archaeon]
MKARVLSKLNGVTSSLVGIKELQASVALLVRYTMAGEKHKLLCIYEYVALDQSPSDIARKYSITPTKVRGYVQRFCAPLRYNTPLAKYVLTKTFGYLIELPEVVVKTGGHYYCTICRKRVGGRRHAEKHPDILRERVEKVLELL